MRRCWRALVGWQLSVGFTPPFYDIDVERDLAGLPRNCGSLRLGRREPRSGWNQMRTQSWKQLRPARPGRDLVKSRRPAGCTGSALILVALTICCTQARQPWVELSFIIPLAVAGIAYLLAIREFFSTPRFPRRVIVIGLVFAALWHVPFLLMPPGSDDDIHRYLWDGRVQRLGYNPYIVVPSDPALAALHTPETRTLNNPDRAEPISSGSSAFLPRRDGDS